MCLVFTVTLYASCTHINAVPFARLPFTSVGELWFSGCCFHFVANLFILSIIMQNLALILVSFI